jgi:WD40 repeat protein
MAQIASGSDDYGIYPWVNVHNVVISPDSQQIASGSADNTVRLRDAKAGIHGLTPQGHIGPIMSVVFSPNGQHIVSGSLDGTVQLWDAWTGAPDPIILLQAVTTRQ